MNHHVTRWALVLGLGAVPLAARPHGPYWGPGQGGGARQEFQADRLAERLHLTDSQKTQLRDIQARYAGSARDKAQAAFEAGRALREAASDPGTTPAQLKLLHQARSDKAFALMLDRRARRNEMRAVLTPEQRLEWDKLQAYRLGLRRGRRGLGR